MRCLVCGEANGACVGDVVLTKPVFGEWADQSPQPEKPAQPESKAAATLAPADVQVDD